MRQSRDSVQDVWGARTPFQGDIGEWPARVDEKVLEEPERWVKSTCVLCSNDCGMDVGVKDGRIVGVRGRAGDRVNKGRLGPKGLHGWMANNSPDRLTRPLLREGDGFREASWDEAMGLIVARSKDLLKTKGPLAFGFYTTGQAFIEDYYTLAIVSKAGLGTPHTDGNTRLCTATAAMALMETFGTDGQPGSYRDIDFCDALFIVGHNMASQQTVLWMRVLDRLAGPNPPQLVVMDPRRTATAAPATVHLANRVGTNVAVLNGLLNLIIKVGRIDEQYVHDHTVGFEYLKDIVSLWPPERVEQIAKVPAAQLREAAEILGTTPRLMSTVLQGVYQSNQATAAAVQVNNLHLIRGMLGRPGCGLLQMNGQPTSQNTRETGDDGALPAFRNWANDTHVAEIARIWNVEPGKIPHTGPTTHAMQIFRYAEQGSIKFLWISATDPCVSLPDLPRIRKILQREELFVVVSEAFLTETAELADVILPAAIWGEKTGTYTNTDRTVHLSEKAVDPPGEARSDMDIWLDYARRMDFRDKDGQPLVKWSTPEDCFEAWKAMSKGRPCDYSGMSYQMLRERDGVQWPCTGEHPDGSERLYAEPHFGTSDHFCESHGHDLETGAAITSTDYRASDPKGKAFLKAADWRPMIEEPDDDYPFILTTGRLVHHWHTRTKTARSAELNAAAPDAYVQISQEDAEKLGVGEGDMLVVESRRGRALAPAKIGDIIPGHVFMPFHYGYWDHPHRRRAANEMTISAWDPVSKQPYFKFAAVTVRKAEEGETGEPGLVEKVAGGVQEAFRKKA